MTMNAPLIAVTMGDPAGIGPEIVAKTFADPGFGDENKALVVGDPGILERAAKLLELPLRVNEIENPEEATFEPGAVDVLAVGELPEDLPFGALDARAGDVAFRYLQRATELANAGRVGAIATAPLNKEAMHLAGHKYPGHTEILAELTATKDRSEEHTSELQSRQYLVCRLLLEKKKNNKTNNTHRDTT